MLKKKNTIGSHTPMRFESGCENWQLGEIKLKYGLTEEPKIQVTSPQAAIKIVTNSIDMDELQVQERFYCIFLNRQQQAIGFRTISTGQLSSVQINVRLLLSIALILNAESAIVVHNHPSGNLDPSEADIDFTVNLIRTAKLIDLDIIDHMILTDKFFSSMRAKNHVRFELALMEWEDLGIYTIDGVDTKEATPLISI